MKRNTWTHLEWIMYLLFILLWSMQSCVAELPIRSYEDVITGADPRLELDNTSLCGNITEGQGISFQRLAMQDDTVYVGGTNHILQIEVPEFSLSQFAVLGPRRDDPGCLAPPICELTCDSLQCTDNKIRLLLPHRDQLIACGSVYAGTCDILNLYNVSQPFKPTPDLNQLKCTGDSQITKHTGSFAVASVFLHGQIPDKDLLYLGAGGPVETYYPPGSGGGYPSLSFKKIDDTSKYTEADVGRHTFVTSWTTDSHNFMIWNTVGGSQSTLSRLCHSTMNEFSREDITEELGYGQSSYTETEVDCAGYTNVSLGYYRYGKLFALFDKDGKYILCSVGLNRINRHLLDARQSCFNGETDIAERIYRDCIKLGNVDNALLTCGLSQAQSKYIDPVRCKTKLEFRTEFVWPAGVDPPTTIAVDFVNGFVSGFFGTSIGEIWKARLGQSSTKFSERIVLEKGHHVLYDVGFDSTKKYLYAMNSNKLFKVKLYNCNQYPTCDACLNSHDPYCGWCVLQSRCTQKLECKDSNLATNWMKIDVAPSQCPSVSNVEPNALSVTETQELALTFGGNTLPPFEYICEFAVADKVLSTSLLYNLSTTPTCSSPPTPAEIPEGQDHVKVTVRVKAETAVVASGAFSVYDCTKIPGINMNTMCVSCVDSKWGCSWCSDSKTCQDVCPESDSVAGRSECPSILHVMNSTDSIPVGKPKEFVLITKNLPPLDYTCVVDVCESASEVRVTGIQDGDEVKCNVEENQLNCPKEDSTVTLSLQSEEYVIDRPRILTVTVGLFNCSGPEAECGLCIKSHERHSECGWCPNVQTCIPQEDCEDAAVADIASCPAPIIDRVDPVNGPTDGGTEISLSGSNLGSGPGEVVSVTIGETGTCQVLPDKYVPSKKIICETDRASQASSGGSVRVQMSYTDNDVISEQAFTYKTVTVTGFEPRYALDGTKVTIFGRNLDIGNSAEVKISNKIVNVISECEDRTPERLVCLLSEAQAVGSYSVFATLDGFTELMKESIEYVKPPNITDLLGREKLTCFRSGGLLAAFKMTSLLGIQIVAIEVNNGEKSSDCMLDYNETSVICPIPSIEERFKRSVPIDDNQASPRAAPTPVSADVVINDRVRLPLVGEKLSLNYVENPDFARMSQIPCDTADTVTQQSRQNKVSSPSNDSDVADKLTDSPSASEKTTTIQLGGSALDYAATKDDYDIKITPVNEPSESINCQTTFLESDSLICKAPSADLNKYVGNKVQVTVKVGNLSFVLNQVEYCPGGAGFPVPALAATVAIVVVLVIIIFVLILCNRKRAKKQRKEREQIMLMLDTLENKTRETARKAYFELQLGYMTTLTDNLSDSITYLPPVSCFMRALFNDWAPDHPMLNSKKTAGMSSSKITGVDDFILLLKNQEFLMTLIRTLEEQKHFTVKEKGQFASLLTVVLFDDLVYFTKVMLELLSELIQKHVSKNPKLLLRRSESVVEKMVSHWLCINLYSQCIRDQAGKPLFLLTKAIHFLVNSAPSDVVANKAVNSLNEMTLLGSEITYEVITLRSSVVEDGEKSDTIEVKVVNCDTITQVKEKIIEVVYRDRPFSECPKPDDMELEMVVGQGHLVLSDIDNMSLEEGNYTQINTLKHYNVPDGANVLLTPMKSKSHDATQNGNSSPTVPKKRRLYHLIHPRDKEVNGFVEEDDVTSGNKTKAIIGNLINRPFQEIYLTRMVKSKTTVQEYVDGVFNAILSPTPISRAVKYFFQFLDREAAKHKINDPEVVHIWKTNSLLLRYWVNVLKNPEFLFDVNKTMIVDSCLNVITQAFMDACTTTNHKLGQDSPSNKLLYAKDAERYRKMVAKFFESISGEESAEEDELNESLDEVSKNYADEFNKRAAAEQLFNFVEKYKSQIQTALSATAEQTDMSGKLEDIFGKLSPDTNGHGNDAILV